MEAMKQDKAKMKAQNQAMGRQATDVDYEMLIEENKAKVG